MWPWSTGNRFLPIGTSQLRLDDLKQILLYPSGLILWNRPEGQGFQDVPVIPLPRFLLSESIPLNYIRS